MVATTSNQDGRDISAIMRKVHSTNTTPEIKFREALDAASLHYETARPDLPGKPDVVVPAARLAIFIDGDYWHGGQWRKRKLTALEEQFKETKSEARAYWLGKIRRNMARDCANTAALLRLGWTVLRFWESDIKQNLEGCVQTTLDVVTNGALPTPFALLPQKTVAEFFAGIGLMRMGLNRQDWSVIWANDHDLNKHSMYTANFPASEYHFQLEDVRNLRARELPIVTLATASFPCTDLSLAGARDGLDGAQSSAFWEFTRILEEMPQRPPFILVENVTGLITSHQGRDFERLIETLNRLGYAVDAFVLDAANFVPQSRERLFIIGIQETLAPASDPVTALALHNASVRPKLLVDFIFKYSTLRWNIRLLPGQPSSPARLDLILEDLPDDAPEWWDVNRAGYLLNQMSHRHRDIADRMISEDRWSYGTVFRRMRNNKSMAELRTDGIAGCLRTPKGGSAKQILFKAGYGKYFARLLTPREAARLMGADDYIISVPRDQALFGFGDAVCVPVVEWIATYYLNPMVNELIHERALAARV